MKVKVNISDPLDIHTELDLNKMTLFIGPNLNGKSLLLRCIYSSVTGVKYNLTVDFKPIGECSVDESFDYTLYIDPYVLTYYIYDKYKSYFEYSESSSEEASAAITALSEIGKDTTSILKLLDIRSLARDEDLSDAINEVDTVVKEIREELKKVNHEEEAKYLLPLRVSVTKQGIEWVDVFGDEGNNVTVLTPSFYPSFVLTAVMYSYALSKKKVKVLLLLDEPEAFTYPSFAYTMGRVIRHLTNKSQYLYTFVITHSWDFYKGVLHGEQNVSVFTFDREGRKVSVKPREKSWYIPGFSVSAILR